MKHIKYMLATLIIVALVGCSSSNNEQTEKPVIKLYEDAKQKLQAGNYQSAITAFESLDNRYPYGSYSQQIQLSLIYAYYKTGEYALALASIDRFLRLNPTHPDLDYVLYMRGLTNIGLDNNSFQSFFGINRDDRDPQFAKASFSDFQHLVKSFPNSQYANDSKQRMIFLKNRLANYDLSIVQFYTKRQAYVAVINRVEQMLRYFPDTEATRQALPLMVNAYHQLNLPDLANKTTELINYNKELVN